MYILLYDNIAILVVKLYYSISVVIPIQGFFFMYLKVSYIYYNGVVRWKVAGLYYLLL